MQPPTRRRRLAAEGGRPIPSRPVFAASRRRRALRLLVALIVLLALAACGGATSSPAASGTSGPGASDPAGGAPSGSSATSSGEASSPTAGEVWLPEWSTDVPDAVAKRRPLPFCGLEKAPAPQPGQFIDRAVRLCFWNAHLARTEAEFASVQTTMEGAPLAVIYRLSSDGTVEVFSDLTQDPFGGNAWLASTCERVVRGEGDALLGVADCTAGEPRD